LEGASFVDEDMVDAHADLLFSGSFGGQRAFVYFLIEHQSEPDPLMPWRVLHYMDKIWERWLRERRAAGEQPRALPPIVTLIVHHGERGWSAPRRLHEIVEGLEALPEIARHVPEMELLLDDLASQGDDGLARREMPPLPKIALFLLRDGRGIERVLAHLEAWAAELDRLARQDATGQDVLLVLRYIMRVSGEQSFKAVRDRMVALVPAAEKPMASAAEQLIQEGIAKGRAQERVQTLRETLARQLARRFGPLDARTRERIDVASAAELERWTDAFAVATSLEDVFGR
jgi:hypothetical protein